MKRFFLLIVLVMLVSWIMASHRSALVRPAGSPRYWKGPRNVHHKRDPGRRIADETRQQTSRTLAEARQALAEVRHEIHQAFDETRDEVRQAFDEVRLELVSDDDPSRGSPPVPSAGASANEDAEGLPVPIVPGTRVTEAEPRPPAPPAPPVPLIAVASAASEASSTPTVTGQLSATAERAKADARRKLRDDVANWLDPNVPRSWTPPGRLLDAMVLKTQVKPIHKPYGTLYEATLTVDNSPQRRTALIEVYNRQLVERRMATLAGTLAFILIFLAAVSGYIRADEATKGYYTNRLRLLAAGGVAASGVMIYHMVA